MYSGWCVSAPLQEETETKNQGARNLGGQRLSGDGKA